MRRSVRTALAVFCFIGTSGIAPAHSANYEPVIAAEQSANYVRASFKHWVDANKNGCNTRTEVLISEAIVKPKVDKKCKITGGKWVSAYDGKTFSNASQLDVDHLVPLAEAWRSGAWAWTPQQRQDFANDLTDTRALIAVSLTTNRSKSDRDISEWVPKVNPCGYLRNWIAVKTRYSLTYDSKEAKALSDYSSVCKYDDIQVEIVSGLTYQAQTPEVTSPEVAVVPVTSGQTPTPTPTPTPSKLTPIKYKNCTEARAAGVTPIRKSSNLELYVLNTALDGDKDGDACE